MTSTETHKKETCEVCGGRAQSCNFEVMSCASCKAFFRRNAFKQAKLQCLFEGDCNISTKTRKFCPCCRLLKCLSVGMNRHLIMGDLEKQKRKELVTLNRKKKMMREKYIPAKESPPPIQPPTTIKPPSPMLLVDKAIQPIENSTFKLFPLPIKLTHQPTTIKPTHQPTTIKPTHQPTTIFLLPENLALEDTTYIPIPSTTPSNTMTTSPSSIYTTILPISTHTLTSITPPTFTTIPPSTNFIFTPTTTLFTSPTPTIEPLKTKTPFTPILTHTTTTPPTSIQPINASTPPPTNPPTPKIIPLPNNFDNSITTYNNNSQIENDNDDKNGIISLNMKQDDDGDNCDDGDNGNNINAENKFYENIFSFEIKTSSSSLSSPPSLSMQPSLPKTHSSLQLLPSSSSPPSSSSHLPLSQPLLSLPSPSAKPSSSSSLPPLLSSPPSSLSSTPSSLSSTPSSLPPSSSSPPPSSSSNVRNLTHNLMRKLSLEECQMIIELNQVYELYFTLDLEPVTHILNSSPSLTHLVNQSCLTFLRIIKFTKKLHDFMRLSQDLQVSILKGSWLHLLLLRPVSLFDAVKGLWTNPMGDIPTEVLKSATGNMHEEHVAYCRSLKSIIGNDNNLLAILLLLVLFCPSSPCLTHPELVSNIQDKYLLLLKHYLEAKFTFKHSTHTFSRLLDKISELDGLVGRHSSILLDVDPQQVEPIMLEMMGVKQNII